MARYLMELICGIVLFVAALSTAQPLSSFCAVAGGVSLGNALCDLILRALICPEVVIKIKQ